MASPLAMEHWSDLLDAEGFCTKRCLRSFEVLEIEEEGLGRESQLYMLISLSFSVRCPGLFTFKPAKGSQGPTGANSIKVRKLLTTRVGPDVN